MLAGHELVRGGLARHRAIGFGFLLAACTALVRPSPNTFILFGAVILGGLIALAKSTTA